MPSFRFAQLPFFAADAPGLCAAYGAAPAVPPAFRRDGLLLLHRGATYCPGRSPLALTWRDDVSSAWSVDVDDPPPDPSSAAPLPPQPTAQQRLLLRLLPSPPGALGTGDAPPAVLAAMPSGWAGVEPPAGTLLRCELLEADGGPLRLDDEGRLLAADLRVLGVAHGRRGEADTCNRVRLLACLSRLPLSPSQCAPHLPPPRTEMPRWCCRAADPGAVRRASRAAAL